MHSSRTPTVVLPVVQVPLLPLNAASSVWGKVPWCFRSTLEAPRLAVASKMPLPDVTDAPACAGAGTPERKQRKWGGGDHWAQGMTQAVVFAVPGAIGARWVGPPTPHGDTTEQEVNAPLWGSWFPPATRALPFSGEGRRLGDE